MLPKEAIEEYKELYKARYGVVLNDDEASFRANNLVNLYRHVYGNSADASITPEGKKDSNGTA